MLHDYSVLYVMFVFYFVIENRRILFENSHKSENWFMTLFYGFNDNSSIKIIV